MAYSQAVNIVCGIVKDSKVGRSRVGSDCESTDLRYTSASLRPVSSPNHTHILKGQLLSVYGTFFFIVWNEHLS